MLERLVAFDTTSRNSNLALIDFIRDCFDRLGVFYRVCPDAAGQKAALHAIIGPREAGGLAFSGHVDTVPVDGQAWTGDPFALRRRDGKLMARGSCDMKGFIACCLAAVPDFQARGYARPLHLLISFDEETSCNGAKTLIRDLDNSGLRPSLCVVGEPSGMQPILAHKGKFNLNVTVRGLAGHSGEPAKGVNAVHAAAEAIAWLSGEARRLAAGGPFEPSFDPPHTTVHVGTMQGGSILNIIPSHAAFTMEWRTIPGDSPYRHMDALRARVAGTIEPAMKAIHPDCGFSYEIELDMPSMTLPENHSLAAAVKQVSGFNSTGNVSYGTEGGFFEKAGIPAIICGPGHIAQAHRADEWIAQSELDACDRFVRRLADRLLA